MVGNDAREVDEGKWKEFGGKVGKGNEQLWSAMCVATCTGHTLGFHFFNIFLHPSILQTQEAKSVNVVAEEIGEPV